MNVERHWLLFNCANLCKYVDSFSVLIKNSNDYLLKKAIQLCRTPITVIYRLVSKKLFVLAEFYWECKSKLIFFNFFLRSKLNVNASKTMYLKTFVFAILHSSQLTEHLNLHRRNSSSLDTKDQHSNFKKKKKRFADNNLAKFNKDWRWQS